MYMYMCGVYMHEVGTGKGLESVWPQPILACLRGVTRRPCRDSRQAWVPVDDGNGGKSFLVGGKENAEMPKQTK